MTMPILEQLVASLIQALPSLFLFGAPFLVLTIVLAAFVDTKLPASHHHGFTGKA